MKFCAKNVKLIEVKPLDKLLFLVVYPFSAIALFTVYSLNASPQEKSDIPQEIVKMKFPDLDEDKSIIKREDVEISFDKDSEGKSSITQSLEWDLTNNKQTSDSPGFNWEEESIYTDEETEQIKRLQEALNPNSEEQEETPEQRRIRELEQKLENATATTNASATPKAAPSTPAPRTKKPIFAQNSTKKNTSVVDNSKTPSLKGIPVLVHGDYKKVRNNTKIIVRTTKNSIIAGREVPKSTFITGIARLGAERINIQFTALHLNNEIIPIEFKAYSLDGLEGVFVEGGILDDTRKEINDEIIDETTKDIKIPIVGEIAKTFSKNENKRVYVHLPSNHPLILVK